MNHYQQPSRSGQTDNHVTFFFRMIRVGNCDRERITKNSRRLREFHAVLPSIRSILLRIPFEERRLHMDEFIELSRLTYRGKLVLYP